ncbi:ABC transporter ATP-binding protein/permease [Litorivicinus sp.]|nr:ABC transporter ATP-binding protein/permease [Litorivicinus sp.]
MVDLNVLRFFYSMLGARIFVLGVLFVVAALFEGLGIVAVIPIVENLIQSGNGSILPDYFEVFGYRLSMQLNLGGWFLTLTSAVLLKTGALVFIYRYSASARSDLLCELKERILNLHVSRAHFEFSSASHGSLLNIAGEQVWRSLQSFFALTQLFGVAVMLVVYLVLVGYLAVELLIAASFMGLLVLIFFKAVNKRVSNASKKLAEASQFVSKEYLTILGGLKYFRITGELPKFYAVAVSRVAEQAFAVRELGNWSAVTMGGRELMIFVCLSGTWLLVYAMNPTLAAGSFLVSLAVMYRAFSSVLAFQGNFQSYLESRSSVLAVSDLLNVTEQAFKKNVATVSERPSVINEDHWIELRAVSVKYPLSDNAVFDQISFDLRKGRSIGLIGVSGSGKTTLIDTLLGLINPSGGIVAADSTLIFGDAFVGSSDFGYVGQQPMVFHGSVLENITVILKCKWESITDAQRGRIIELCDSMGLTDLVSQLPDGFDSLISEDQISGGQKQKIALARELLKNPKILVLDEPFSALDAASRSDIIAILQNRVGFSNDATLLIIGHAKGDIDWVDDLLMIEDGKITNSISSSASNLNRGDLSYLLK